MVRTTQIGHQELCTLEACDKDRTLQEHYNLTNEDFQYIRTAPTRVKGAYRAAETLAEKGYGDQITLSVLAALVYAEWHNPHSHRTSLADGLMNIYKEERERLREQTGHAVSAIHCLREDVDAYTGNLMTATETYPQFKASSYDLLRNVTLPIEWDAQTARLLGVYWADAITYGESCFRLEGSTHDADWYAHLKDELAAVHNLRPHYYQEEREATAFFSPNAPLQYTRPRLVTYSKALVSWLRDDLQFRQQLPDCDTDEQRLAFLSGFVAGKGNIDTTETVTLYGSDWLLTDIARLCHTLDLSPSHGRKEDETGYGYHSRYLRLGRPAVRDLAQEDFFWHPHHLHMLNGQCANGAESP